MTAIKWPNSIVMFNHDLKLTLYETKCAFQKTAYENLKLNSKTKRFLSNFTNFYVQYTYNYIFLLYSIKIHSQNLQFVDDAENLIVTHNDSVWLTRVIEQPTDFVMPTRPCKWQTISKLLTPGRKFTIRNVKLSDLQTSWQIMQVVRNKLPLINRFTKLNSTSSADICSVTSKHYLAAIIH